MRGILKVFAMSVGMNPSYLTNLDFQMTVNHDGTSVSYSGAGGSADKEFARQVGVESGAAMAELVNARGEAAVEGEIVTIVVDPAAHPDDPVVLAAKEILKQDAPLPDAPLPVADPAPVVTGKQPPKRDFELPPQHIIDAKTITVTETPSAPDGVQLEPIERKMIKLAPDIFLPTPDDVENQGEILRGAVKSFILPRREIERACNDSVNQLFEMYTGVLSRFVGMIESGDENFETGSTQNLVRYYIDLMRNEYRFLDEACRDYLPVPVMDQVGEIGNIMNDVESLLPIIDDPNMMRAVENVLRGFGSNVSHLVQSALERGLEGIEFVASVIGAIAAFVYGLNPSLRPH